MSLLNRIDGETVIRIEIQPNGDRKQVVDADASSTANVNKLKQDFSDIFDGGNHFRSFAAGNSGTHPIAQLAAIVAASPVLAAQEVGDVFLGPVRIVKNGGDAVVWGAIASIAKIIKR